MKNKYFFCIQSSKRDNHNQKIFSVEHSLINYFSKNNIELYLSNPYLKYKNLKYYDGLIITGGNDVFKNKKNFCPIRFNFEENIIYKFLNLKKPIIAICYGFQRLNLFFGGKVTSSGKTSKFNYKYQHNVEIDFENIKLKTYTNHYHDDFIKVQNLSKKLKTIAIDPVSNTVEAAYSIRNKVYAIQWHPERKYSNKNLDKFLFKTFFSLL